MTEVQKTGVSRRTVAKGLAWSVPVVAVATAAPAMAASGSGPTLTPGPACKNPGNSCKVRPKGYTFPIEVCNQTTKDIYVYGAVITSTTLTDLTFDSTEPTRPFLVAAGQCVQAYFNASSNNSSNLVFTAHIQVTWGHTPDPADDTEHDPIPVDVVVNGTPPDCVCPA